MDDHDGIVYFTFSFFLQYKHTCVKEIVHFKKYMTYLLTYPLTQRIWYFLSLK